MRTKTRTSPSLTALRFLTVLSMAFSLLPLAPALAAPEGTVGLQFVMGTGDPDTRGGMVMDDQYVWISAHKNGLWRVDRCTGANTGDTTGNDNAAWDLWWYNAPLHDGYPSSPGGHLDPGGTGYYIYEAGNNGVVYVIDTASPSSIVGSVSAGGVAYGIYATESATHKLYVATTLGLKVYDISTPTSPSLPTTVESGLDFTSVRGLEGHGYVYAASYSDNKLYIVSTATDTVVSSIGFGMSGMIRNPWVYQDDSGNMYVYVVNDKGDLWIVDVNTPASPTIVSSWNSPAGGDANMPGGASYVRQDYAFVLTSDGNDKGHLYMLDVRDPTNPIEVDHLYDSDFGFNDIRMEGCEIHIAAHDGWKMYTMVGWQPDSEISNTDQSNYVGQDIYEDVPVVQIKEQTVAPNQTATFQIRIENDADQRDKFRVTGDGSTTGWTVQYLDAGGDVTGDITATPSTYLTDYMELGGFFVLTLKVTPDFNATCGQVYEVTITPDSWMCPVLDHPVPGCSGSVDVVKARITLGCPDMTVAKDDGKTTVTEGDSLPYAITYSNTGNAAAANVVITDVLPSGTTYVSSSPSYATKSDDSPSPGETTLTWNIGAVPASSGPYTITLNATVDVGTAVGSVLTDTVTLAYTDVPGSPYPDETDDDVDDVVGSPVVKEVDKANAAAGDTLTYTITLSYGGSTLLSNAVVTDAIPAGTTYITDTDTPEATVTPADDATATLVTWDLGSNDPGTPGVSPGAAMCPGTMVITATKDTWIDSGSTDNNWGADVRFDIDSDAVRHGLVYFPVSSSTLPAGSQLQSASLQLTVESGQNADRKVSIRELTYGSWTEGTGANTACAGNGATWNAPNCTDTGPTEGWDGSGNDFGTAAPYGSELDQISPAVDEETYPASVTSVVNGWLGGSPDYGFVLLAIGPDAGTVRLHTREGAAGKEPKLVLNYLEPTPGGCSDVTTIAVEADTHVRMDSPEFDNNYGGKTLMETRPGGTDVRQSLIRFGLDAIPPGATINSVSLKAQSLNTVADHSISVREATRSWTEGTLDNGACTTGGDNGATWKAPNCTDNTTTGWNGSGGDFSTGPYGSTDYGTLTPDSSLQTITNTDLKNLVQSWVDGTATNYGFVLLASGTSESNAQWGVKEDGNGAELVVDWELAGGTGTGNTMDAMPRLVMVGEQITVTQVLTQAAQIGSSGSVDVRVGASADDAEQCVITGTMYLTSSDLEMVNDPGTADCLQKVGMRFTGVTVPQGATITSAYLEFVAWTSGGLDEISPTTLTFAAHDTDNAPTFTTAGFDITNRTETTAKYTWASVPTWSDETTYQTPDLSSVIQEIVDIGTWSSGNAIVMLVSGSGERTGYAYDGSTAKAPLLHIDWNVPGGYPTDVVTPTLIFTGTNGVTASLVSGPTPPSAVVTGTGTTFTWVYTGTAATGNIGELTFGGDATDGTETWPWATSNSVIVVPPLTFQVEVDDPITTNPVLNTGYFKDNNVFPGGTSSNEVETKLGGSIGDYVWYDADGEGDQDVSESAIGAGVVITLTPPAGVDLGAGAGNPITTTTDANGLYSFQGLAAGTYTVTLDTATLPPNMALTTSNDLAITITNADRLDADFGADDTATIGNFVWADDNGDGTQDEGAGAGIPDITVSLYDITGTLIATTTTDVSGIYTFTGLPAGDYTVYADESDPDMPAGYEPTTTNPLPVTLTAGQQYEDADFGFTDLGAIGDRIWEDENGDGVQDAGELGLADVQIILTDDFGNTQYATTDATGVYTFTDLPSGTYTVTVNAATLPAGYAQTGDPDATLDGQHVVNLAVGQNYDTADFGYDGTGVIGDFVWRDLDGDGIQDGGSETGIPDITVWLYEDQDGDGTIDPGEPLLMTDTTDANGLYSFAGLPPGDYVVDVDENDPQMPDYTNSTPDPLAVDLGPAEIYNDADFGFGPYAQIGDYVWNDLNGDRNQDPGEPPLAGVVITLTPPSGVDAGGGPGVPVTTTTDSNGYYLFDVLDAAPVVGTVYTLTVQTPAGYQLTTGNDPYVETLTVGEYHEDADFGFRGTGAIGDYVWDDADGQGDQDAGESGLPGITVYLFEDSNGNGRNDDGEPFVGATPTDANGIYTFTNLPAGDYVVLVQEDDPALPANYGPTTFQPIPVSLAEDEIYQDADFGFGPSGSIGDTVYYDANGNGEYDTGTSEEYGIPGITVWLYSDPNGNGDPYDDGSIISTTETITDGFYFFGGLPADGSTDYVAVMDSSDPDIPAGLQLTTLNPYPVQNLPAGEFYDEADFGLRGTSAIGNFVWHDTDGEGDQDEGAGSGIGDITVELWEESNGVPGLQTGPGGDDRVAVTSTLASGIYTFTNLVNGTYYVDVDESDPDMPAGYSLTTGNDPLQVVISAPGTNYDQADFGFASFVSIGDFVWDDLNRNGRQDAGEPGLDGVTVLLYDAGPDGDCSTPGDWVITSTNTTTAGGGLYSFSGLPGNTTYCVDVVEATLPAGYLPTLDNRPPDDDGDSDSINGAPAKLITTGGLYDNVDFGFYQLQPAISIVKTLLDPPGGIAVVSDTITFTMRITNTGETIINSLQVTDTWEACMDLTSADPVTNTQSASQATWNLTGLNLAIGASTLITVDFHAASGDSACDNYGTATGEDVNGEPAGPQSDSDDVQIQALEYGDAPEGGVAYPGTPSTPGQFPTCITVGAPASYVQHGLGWAHFTVPGAPQAAWDPEPDGNAGLCPTCFPTYDDDECYLDGDAGLMFPEPYTIIGPVGSETVVKCPNAATGTALGAVNQTAVWAVDVDIWVVNNMPVVGYVNVLMDWNQNGVWTDPGEHVLVDFVVPLGYNGPLSALGPPSFTIGPNGGYVWSRFSVTEKSVGGAGWDGSGVFEDGESEDYLLWIEDPVIGLAKNADSVVNNGDGTYTITFTLTISNYGNVVLNNIVITDDIVTQFAGLSPIGFSASNGTLTASGTWDGTAGSNILAAGQSLAVGASGTVLISFTVTPGSTTSVNNTAYSAGTSPDGTTVTDQSQDGLDPDPDGNNDPADDPTDLLYDNDEPTPVSFTENPVIGAAKDVASVTGNGNGTYTVVYTITLENLGDIILHSVQVTDDLDITFQGAVSYTVDSVSSTYFTVNWPPDPAPNYDGSTDINLLASGNSLAAGDVRTIMLTVLLNPGYNTGIYYNWAYAYGTSPAASTVSDWSDPGINPDPSGNGDPSDGGYEDNPTPLEFAQVWGYIFEDSNGNGSDDGEPPLAGVSVVITDSGGVTQTVTTDASGRYTATVPGGWTTADVDENSLPPNYTQTAGTDPTTVNAPAGSLTHIGDDGYQPPLATVGDLVWWDINGDGVQDGGQPGIEGVDVVLSDGGSWTTTTDANGLYTFTNVLSDTYSITIPAYEFAPGGTLYTWFGSPQDVVTTTDALDSDADPVSHQITTTLDWAEVDPTQDFGFDITSSYTITKQLNTMEPVRVDRPLTFTIRITNTGWTTITVLPLRDVYSTTYLTYGYTDTFGVGTFASPDSNDHHDDGVIDWSDLTVSEGDLAPNDSVTVIVTFTANADTHHVGLPNDETEDTATAHDVRADPDGLGGPLPEETLPAESASEGVGIVLPTGVVLSSLNAVARPDGVLVTWQTASELDVLGFNLLRAEAGREWELINEVLIFAEWAGAEWGADYGYRDGAVAPGTTYHYLLEIVKSDGSVEQYELGSVTACWWLNLPLIAR